MKARNESVPGFVLHDVRLKRLNTFIFSLTIQIPYYKIINASILTDMAD